MPEELQGQDPNDSGQAPDPETDADPAGGAPTDPETARARADAAKYRTQLRETQKSLKELQDAAKEKEDAEKTELQKVIDRATLLESQLREKDEKVKHLTLRQEVLLAAGSQSIIDPDGAYRLLDTAQVEYDEEGNPTNIDDLLTKLVEAKPYLKGSGSGGGAPRPKSSTSTSHPDGDKKRPLTKADVEAMTDDEVNARWDEVQLVLAGKTS